MDVRSITQVDPDTINVRHDDNGISVYLKFNPIKEMKEKCEPPLAEIRKLEEEWSCMGKEVYRMRDCLRVVASRFDANIKSSEEALEGGTI